MLTLNIHVQFWSRHYCSLYVRQSCFCFEKLVAFTFDCYRGWFSKNTEHAFWRAAWYFYTTHAFGFLHYLVYGSFLLGDDFWILFRTCNVSNLLDYLWILDSWIFDLLVKRMYYLRKVNFIIPSKMHHILPSNQIPQIQTLTKRRK